MSRIPKKYCTSSFRHSPLIHYNEQAKIRHFSPIALLIFLYPREYNKYRPLLYKPVMNISFVYSLRLSLRYRVVLITQETYLGKRLFCSVLRILHSNYNHTLQLFLLSDYT